MLAHRSCRGTGPPRLWAESNFRSNLLRILPEGELPGDAPPNAVGDAETAEVVRANPGIGIGLESPARPKRDDTRVD